MVGMTTAFETAHPRGAAGRFTAKVNDAPGCLLAAPAATVDERLAQPHEEAPGARYDAAGWVPDTPWDDVTDADRELFTLEHCSVLADELHARTGWPIVAFGDGDYIAGWCHVGVLTPAGLIADVEGLHDPLGWADRWGEHMCQIGYDYDDFDDETVWAYDARNFGWAGDGHPLTTWEVTPEARADAARIADRILDHDVAAAMMPPQAGIAVAR